MTKTKKFWLGFFTFLPVLGVILYCVLFFLFFIGMKKMEVHEPNHFPFAWFTSFGMMFLAMFTAIVSGIGMMIYYIMHAVKNKGLSENDRLIWILILVLASGIGSFIYFFVVILPLKTPDKLQQL